MPLESVYLNGGFIGTTTSYALEEIISYRYVRWVITGKKGASAYLQASEFRLQLNGSDISMSGVTVTNPGGSNAPGETPPNLIDDNTSTKWIDFNGPTSTLVFDFGAGNSATFNGYRWATANDTTDRDPDDWTVQVSNDNSNWTTVDTVVNAAVTNSRLTFVGPYTNDTVPTTASNDGIFNLQAVLESLGETPLTTVSFVTTSGASTSTSVSTASATIPASAQAGDLAIAAYSIDLQSPSMTTPAGWTLIGNGDTAEYPRMYVFAKILEAGDPNTSLTTTISPAEGYTAVIIVFRPDGNIASFTGRNFTNQKGTSSLSDTLSNSGATPLTIAFAFLTGRTSQSPTLTFSGATIQTDTSDSGTRSVGYIIYESGSSPANLSASCDDQGRQSMSMFYLDLA
jgi:hypothetical protein